MNRKIYNVEFKKKCTCGCDLNENNTDFIGIQHGVNKNKVFELWLFNCEKCCSTIGIKGQDLRTLPVAA